MKKSVLKFRLEKDTFWRLIRGGGGSGHACLTMQILQKLEGVSSRPAPPAGVRRISRASPSAPGPLAAGLLVFGCLVPVSFFSAEMCAGSLVSGC